MKQKKLDRRLAAQINLLDQRMVRLAEMARRADQEPQFLRQTKELAELRTLLMATTMSWQSLKSALQTPERRS